MAGAGRPVSQLLASGYPGIDPVSAESDWIFGNPEAGVSLISYMDFTCPHCRQVRPVLKRVVNRSDQTVNWVYRHFLSDEPGAPARQMAASAECAGRETGNAGFWRFLEAAYSLPGGAGATTGPDLALVARKAGLDADALRECAGSGVVDARLDRALRETANLPLLGTPAILIRDHASGRGSIIQGAASAQQLQAALEAVRSGAKD